MCIYIYIHTHTYELFLDSSLAVVRIRVRQLNIHFKGASPERQHAFWWCKREFVAAC